MAYAKPNKKKKKPFRTRRRNRWIAKDVTYVDYKDTELLEKFINNQGRIIAAAASGLTAKQQRVVTRAIKRARQMALLPYSKERIRR